MLLLGRLLPYNGRLVWRSLTQINILALRSVTKKKKFHLALLPASLQASPPDVDVVKNFFFIFTDARSN